MTIKCFKSCIVVKAGFGTVSFYTWVFRFGRTFKWAPVGICHARVGDDGHSLRTPLLPEEKCRL